MSSLRRDASPDLAEDLATDTFASCLPPGHHPFRRGHDGDSKATLHAADLVTANVDAAARAGYALDVTDDGLVVRAVLQIDAEDFGSCFLGRLIVCDVAFFLEDASDLRLQTRRGHVKLLMASADGVADTRQKVCYWVGQIHSFSFASFLTYRHAQCKRNQ